MHKKNTQYCKAKDVDGTFLIKQSYVEFDKFLHTSSDARSEATMVSTKPKCWNQNFA